jgi:pimeloyl-ACP methyl ester carboxylesterase
VAGPVIAVHDLGGTGPILVMAHAAGLHGLVLGPLARRLAGRLHCVSFDHRGHGDTPLPPGEALDWHGLAADVLEVVDRLGLPERPYGFGHSSGGTAVLMAEQARPGTFAALSCYEPVLVAADPPLGPDRGSWLAEAARRRRASFASREEAVRHFSSRPPFDALDPEVLGAYVDHGLTAAGQLKCRPEDEAAVYETATAHDAYGRLPEVACPVLVACGSASEACAPAHARALAARLPQGRCEVLDGLGHLGPLERPAAVAASILAFVG